MKQRILVTWIGHTDLWQMAREADHSLEMVKQVTRAKEWPKKGSPVQVLVTTEHFEEIHILSNYSADVNKAYEAWLGKQVSFHHPDVSDPWDYTSIFRETEKALDAIVEARPKAELCIHLTSGTQAMSAVLLLLGATTFSPARFFQTFHHAVHSRNVSEVNLPFDLRLTIQEHFENADRYGALAGSRPPAEVPGFEHIVGESTIIRSVVERARRAALRSVNVLLLGESGVGKELFARAIHQASGRKGRFVAVNCGAIPEDLLESELFGAVKGAASGITKSRNGYFAEADKGTLFLDEIGTLTPRHQAKLLRVIGSGNPKLGPTSLQVNRLGESGEGKRYDIRIVSATNRDLEAEDYTGAFRGDLFYRLNTFPILIPALRERSGDIAPIAEHLVTLINQEGAKSEPGSFARTLSTGALRRLQHHDWPGNVRELNSVLWRALIMSSNPEVSRQEIDREIVRIDKKTGGNIFSRTREENFRLIDRLKQMERAFIEDALDDVDRVQSKAAKLLGDRPGTLNQRIQRFKIITRSPQKSGTSTFNKTFNNRARGERRQSKSGAGDR